MMMMRKLPIVRNHQLLHLPVALDNQRLKKRNEELDMALAGKKLLKEETQRFGCFQYDFFTFFLKHMIFFYRILHQLTNFKGI